MWLEILLLLLVYGVYYVLRPYIYYLKVRNPRSAVLFYPIKSVNALDEEDLKNHGDVKFTTNKVKSQIIRR